ncbi:tol-pal system protein YbgF [Longimicrobium sp.]|uniref:tol-pal system protein YbgF n=1 Tax=Longimicrobium sp. TaxID=2029185 RepID=UPI002E30CA22|nr:tol-pal system protein YbgF [Longimicrobium sp.]HEX6040642.1 tol-pal system protein YbgF [Longimicrobium sp.]
MKARTLFALALLPLAGACVATKQDVQELRLDMAQQRAHQDSLFRALVGRTEAMLDSLSDQNVRLRGDVANRLLAIERQLVQIQELSGANQAQLSDLRRQIDQRAAEERRRQQEAADAAAAGQDGGGGSAADAGDPDELYEAAQAALRRGSVGTARAGFEEFIRANPQHRLAPEAQYNIGQSYEQGRDTGNAITAYGRVVELYPTSGRAPAALLRMGRLELGRGNRTEARARLNQIVQRYPRAPEAGEARTELQRLGTR